jgi:hypothetical protein
MNIALDSRKVLINLGEYRKRLKSALQDGNDYALLHADILRFLKIVCKTKSEYRDVVVYSQPPGIREIVIMTTNKNGKSVELESRPTYSENELSRNRLELGERLQSLLSELEAEYDLRKNLEANLETRLKSEVQDLKKEVFRLKLNYQSVIKRLYELQ